MNVDLCTGKNTLRWNLMKILYEIKNIYKKKKMICKKITQFKTYNCTCSILFQSLLFQLRFLFPIFFALESREKMCFLFLVRRGPTKFLSFSFFDPLSLNITIHLYTTVFYAKMFNVFFVCSFPNIHLSQIWSFLFLLFLFLSKKKVKVPELNSATMGWTAKNTY